jgi:hypothetical protein
MIRRLVLAGLAAMALSACSAVGPGLETSSAPAQERLGAGGSVIGVLSFAEPGNLAGGAVDSTYQAARLAAATIVNSPVTIEIRSGEAAESAARELAEADARIAILPADPTSASKAASVLAKRGAPSISLARAGDETRNLYGAGFDPAAEVEALTDEVVRRGIARLAVLTAPTIPSQLWAAAVIKVLRTRGVTAEVVDGSDLNKAQAVLGGLPDIGAIVFATSPEQAAGIGQAMRSDPARAKLAFFASAEWALAASLPSALGGSIYAAPEGSRLREYARRFTAAAGARPTLASALVYDLIVMAAALQQAAPSAPYDRATLASSEGFVGFSGAFAFTRSGAAMPRRYAIHIAE